VDKFAIYVHWPYCARICPYCDFNVYKQREDAGLAEAIIDDLKGWREWSGPRVVTSIHFGGGTPSLMSGDDIEAIIDTVREWWELDSNCEIAIEANPNDADTVRWTAYHAGGINRLSLGVQTFHDPALKLLGRDHSAEDAQSAVEMAVNIFPSVSLDLIFGWAGQTDAILQQDMDLALASGAQHISAYQLTIEEGTAFAKAEARGDMKAVDADKSADFYDLVRQRLTSEGFGQYEVSNFARPGHRSQHNLTYWQSGDYVGAGPGAHGRLTVDGTRYATVAAMRPADYQECVSETGIGITEKETLSPKAHAEEYLLMGLRIEAGISASRFESIAGRGLKVDVMSELVENGLILCEGDNLKVTHTGRLVLNTVTEKLLLN